jgi:hypothetical protein
MEKKVEMLYYDFILNISISFYFHIYKYIQTNMK